MEASNALADHSILVDVIRYVEPDVSEDQDIFPSPNREEEVTEDNNPPMLRSNVARKHEHFQTEARRTFKKANGEKGEDMALTRQRIDLQKEMDLTQPSETEEELQSRVSRLLGNLGPSVDQINPELSVPLGDDFETQWETPTNNSDPDHIHYPSGNNDPIIDTTSLFTTDKDFDSKDDVLEWAQISGRPQGIVCVTKKSQSPREDVAPRLYVICERGGAYREPKNGMRSTRDTGTKKHGCPFELRTKWRKEGGVWKGNVFVYNGYHNHELAKCMNGHSFAGRLTRSELQLVRVMSMTGSKPKNIHTALLQNNPDNTTSRHQLYNARNSMRIELRGGRSQMQELCRSLSEKRYVFATRRNAVSEVTAIFWSHPHCVHLARSFPYVFQMDCTYKTNQYHWNLLEIVGVTPTKKSFTVAHVLMEAEKEFDYTWALIQLKGLVDPIEPLLMVTDRDFALINALGAVFPNVTRHLCRFHIHSCVLGKAKEYRLNEDQQQRVMDIWALVVKSPSEDLYIKRLRFLFRELKQWKGLLNYISSIWLPHKENFVSAWINKHYHFGQTTTNRVEGMHAKLKETLKGRCQFDFLGIWREIDRALDQERQEIRASLEVQVFVRKHRNELPIFADLHGWASHACMDEIRKEMKWLIKMEETKKPCYHRVRNSLGIPCACELRNNYMNPNIPIPPSVVHRFWCYQDLQMHDLEFDESLDPKQLIETVTRCLEDAPLLQRRSIMSTISEVIQPETTTLRPPVVPAKPKGRQIKKKSSQPNNLDGVEQNDPWDTEFFASSTHNSPGAASSQGRSTSPDSADDHLFQAVRPISGCAKRPAPITPSSSNKHMRTNTTSPQQKDPNYVRTPSPNFYNPPSPGTTIPAPRFIQSLQKISKKVCFYTPKPSVRDPKGPSSDPYSNRRNPSSYERKVKQLGRPRRTQLFKEPRFPVPLCDSDFKIFFPQQIAPYVIDTRNVSSDGNCGFRSLAESSMMDDSNWLEIRRQLSTELIKNILVYHEFFSDGLPMVLESLNHVKGKAPASKWIRFPAHGYLFAQRYQCYVVHLSNTHCWTYPPVLPEIKSIETPKVVCIGWLGQSENHYISLTLDSLSPLPPVPNQYFDIVSRDVSTFWVDKISWRLEAWKDMRIPGLATSTSP